MRIFFIFIMANAYSFDGGVTQLPYLVKILSENIKRYEQLKTVIRQGENSEQLLRVINEGINNASGLLTLQKVARGSFEFQKIYGEIPKNEEAIIYRFHDQSAAEGLGMVISFKEYAKKMEQNAQKVFGQAVYASPKGAQRMTAQMTAQILHALNQLIRINAQILQLQSEQLASSTKKGKDSGRHFKRVQDDMTEALERFKSSPRFPKF